MRVNRFVLDTNIWISYIITNSHNRLVDIIDLYELDVFSCSELFHEVEKVLKYRHLEKYNVNSKAALRFIETITTQFQLTYPVKNYIPEDEDDNYIIALALQTNAGFVTSGDVHILARKEQLETRFRKLRIITKAEFERMFPLKQV
jgi:uncharacterized protein